MPGDLPALAQSLGRKLQALEGEETGRGGRGNDPKSLTALRTSLLGLMGVFQEADVAPSSQATAAIGDLQKAMAPLWERWQSIKTQDIPAINAQLRNAKLPELQPDAPITGTQETTSGGMNEE